MKRAIINRRSKPAHTQTAIAACFAFGIFLLVAGSASAQNAPGVIYSYEQVQVGNTAQWVLIPNVMKSTLTDDLETNLRAAFKGLRSAKPPTYGRSNLVVDPKLLKKGSVTVDIDDDKVKYQLIIEAEVAQTFAQFGIVEVSFKAGDADRVVRPSENPFTTYSLTLPIWRALPPATAAVGDVRFSDGSEMSFATFSEKLKAKDEAMLKRIYKELQNAAPLAQIGMLERLPALKLPDFDASVLKLLKDDDASVRIAAVKALEGSSDKDTLDALVAVLDKDKDPGVQSAAAGSLSKASNPKYSAYGIYFALRSDDANAALIAVDELVSRKVTDAGDELIKALANKDPRVGRRVATAMRELGLDKQLLSVLGKTDYASDVQEQIALEVSQLGDKEDAFKGHSWLVANGSERNAVASVEALARYKDPEPFAPLEKGLDSKHSKVRRASATALGGLKEDDSLKAMAKAAAAYPEDQEAIEEQMVVLLVASEKLSDLEDRTKKEKDSFMKRSVYRALGRKAADADRFKQVEDKLIAGLDESDELARGGAIIGLAQAATDDHLALLAPKGTDDSSQVRMDVARALSNYPEGKATDVLARLSEDKEPRVAVAAIETYGKRKEIAVAKALMKLGKGADPAVRIALIANMPLMMNADNQPDVVAFISNALFDDNKKVKKAAIAALGAVADNQSIASLALLVQDPDPEIRFATFDALAASQSLEAISLLVQGTTADDAITRKRAVEAMVAHGSITSRPELEALAKTETDSEVKAAIKKALEVLK